MTEAAPKLPPSLAIASGKGGVGKTTLAANLAVALAVYGRRVALFDADMGLANANLLLGLDPTVNVGDVLRGSHDVVDALVEGPSGLRLLSGGHGSAELSDLTPGACVRIADALTPLRSLLDLLVVDTAPGLSAASRSFISACDLVLLVLGPEPAAFMDAYALMKTLRLTAGRRDFLVTANMVDSAQQGERLFHQFDSVAGRFLDVRLTYAGAVPMDACVRSAAMVRVSLVERFPQSPASRAIHDIAAIIAERLPALAEAA